MRVSTLLLLGLFAAAPLSAQVVPARSGTDAEFRAMYAPSDSVVWAAGRNGQYSITRDGGASWTPGSIPGAGDLFITGFWARDARTAVALATSFDGGLARIYRTADGGGTWQPVYEAGGAGVFFDALRCWDDAGRRCVAFGDPVGGRFHIARIDGDGWHDVPHAAIPAPLPREAGFAASGTAMATAGSAHAWIGSGGGATARVYRTRDGGASWEVFPTPMPADSTSGIFGIAFTDTLNGVAVGGDYLRRHDLQQNVLRTVDGGRTWTVVGASQPAGVRYGVAIGPALDRASTPRRIIAATGPSGTGISGDGGSTWVALDTVHYNTLTFTPAGDLWLGGPAGRLARIPASSLARALPPSNPNAPSNPNPNPNSPSPSNPPSQEYPTRFSRELAAHPQVSDALAWVEANFDAQVEEWKRITEMPGTSRNEQQRAAYIREQLEAEGFVVTVDSIGNVVARRRGTGGGETVVYAAHMDTVHPLDTDVTVSEDSAEVAGERRRVLRAPGIFDNSASVANMLALARALNRAGVQTRGDIVFIATVQEELGLLGMEYWLEHNPGVADVLIALDGGLPYVNYGALGIYWSRYFFRGAGAHTNNSAGQPHPARALADAVQGIYQIEIPEYMGGAVYNVGMLDGGKIFNAIPEEVSFTMDLRSVNPILLNDLDAQIDSAVARAAAAHGVRWERERVLQNRAGGTAQMLEERRTHPLIQTALDAHAFVGIESRAIASGSTDANAGVVRGIPSISIGRSLGGDQHTLSEWADVDSALPATRIALLIGIAMAGLAVPGT